jgi:hypothetical protein
MMHHLNLAGNSFLRADFFDLVPMLLSPRRRLTGPSKPAVGTRVVSRDSELLETREEGGDLAKEAEDRLRVQSEGGQTEDDGGGRENGEVGRKVGEGGFRAESRVIVDGEADDRRRESADDFDEGGRFHSLDRSMPSLFSILNSCRFLR